MTVHMAVQQIRWDGVSSPTLFARRPVAQEAVVLIKHPPINRGFRGSVTSSVASQLHLAVKWPLDGFVPPKALGSPKKSRAATAEQKGPHDINM